MPDHSHRPWFLRTAACMRVPAIILDHLKHVEEYIELMNAVTNSKRFSDLSKLIKERGGDTMMTILFDVAEARGENKGQSKKQ